MPRLRWTARAPRRNISARWRHAAASALLRSARRNFGNQSFMLALLLHWRGKCANGSNRLNGSSEQASGAAAYPSRGVVFMNMAGRAAHGGIARQKTRMDAGRHILLPPLYRAIAAARCFSCAIRYQHNACWHLRLLIRAPG